MLARVVYLAINVLLIIVAVAKREVCKYSDYVLHVDADNHVDANSKNQSDAQHNDIKSQPDAKCNFDTEAELKVLRNEHGFNNIRCLATGGFGEVAVAECVDPKKQTWETCPINEQSPINLKAKKCVFALRAIECVFDNKTEECVFDLKTKKIYLVEEPETLGELHGSPFVLTVYSFFYTQVTASTGVFYIVTDYVDGKELSKVLEDRKRKRKPFSVPAVKFYASQIVAGIAYMHNKKVAYRDLKPENLMVNNDNVIVIVDMGLAERCDEPGRPKKRKCNVDFVAGTPGYLAPEYPRDEKGRPKILKNGEVREAYIADWYGVGLVLYELCVGHLPKDTDPPLEDMKLRDLLQKLLEENPSKRLGYSNENVNPERKGASDVMKHQFFEGVNWNALLGEPQQALKYLKEKAGNLHPEALYDGRSSGMSSSGRSDRFSSRSQSRRSGRSSRRSSSHRSDSSSRRSSSRRSDSSSSIPSFSL